MGLPPACVTAAVQEAVTQWAQGRACPVAYDHSVSRARASYAALVDVAPDRIAVGSQTSVFVGQVAASLPAGSEVLCVSGDFTSVTFPFLVAQDRGVRVRQVPLADLVEEIGPQTSLVAFSLVQSANGMVAPAKEISRAAAAAGALTLADVTQAAGWMPVRASDFDLSVCSAYKWLCQPRGTAYLSVATEVQQRLRPINAGWYAGGSIWDSVYGPDMALASDARRFDVSPAWLSWVGAAAAGEVFASLPMKEVRTHATSLAAAFTGGIEEAGPHCSTDSAIVSVPDPDGALVESLGAAGLAVSSRAGAVRLAFHAWNTEDDVERALTAVRAVRAGGARSR